MQTRNSDAVEKQNMFTAGADSASALCSDAYGWLKQHPLATGTAVAVGAVAVIALRPAMVKAQSATLLREVDQLADDVLEKRWSDLAAAFEKLPAWDRGWVKASDPIKELSIHPNLDQRLVRKSLEFKPLSDSDKMFDLPARLEPGRYELTWSEFSGSFFNNEHRQHLGQGMLAAIKDLQNAGCKRVEVGGSFVSSKPLPKDFDLVFQKDGVDMSRVDSTISSKQYWLQQNKFGGELFADDVHFNSPYKSAIDMIRQTRRQEEFGTVVLDLHQPLPNATKFKPFSYGEHERPLGFVG